MTCYSGKGTFLIKVEVIEVRGRGGQEDQPKQSCMDVCKRHGEISYFVCELKINKTAIKHSWIFRKI